MRRPANGYFPRYASSYFNNFTLPERSINAINSNSSAGADDGREGSHRRLVHFGESTPRTPSASTSDRIRLALGLYAARATQPLSTTRKTMPIKWRAACLAVRDRVEPAIWTTFGLRGDVYHWNITSDNPLNSGRPDVGLASTKIGCIRRHSVAPRCTQLGHGFLPIPGGW